MKIEGSARVRTPPAEAWRRIIDPETLRRCTPGLASLTETSPDHYEAVIELKLPAIRGRFEGAVDFLERHEPERLRMRFEGRGAPGFVSGEVALALAPADAGTEFRYEADVQVGGQVARLGQRMVSGVAKDMASQFFAAFERLDELPAGASAAPSPLAAFFGLLWRTILRALGRS